MHNVTDPYQAALTAACYFIQTGIGYFSLSGQDQVAFLQRQTTNDIHLLNPGRAVLTVLTSPTARILDVLLLLQEPGLESIALLCLPGKGDITFRYLKSRIFFMDKVTLSNDSQEFVHIDLIGPQSRIILTELGLPSPPAANDVFHVTYDSSRVNIIGLEPSFSLGYRLVIPAQISGIILAALRRLEIPEIDEKTYGLIRVEAGIPAVGHELSEDYTPLEAGLKTAIADNKGCYTGQEIIARQITYDKITQHLSGLSLMAPTRPGAALWAEDKPVGAVTSYVNSPRFGHIALGIIKRPFHTPGCDITVKDGSMTLDATVTQIPFSQSSR